ncbi:calmodulin-dependent protein kinase [Gigaspora margarita]|uniref:Calmodulin-dependent protein kinase n=1 Tax=Gigaspora margarita TaxID=4874 RepID=A0A8H3WSM5_GIGMA|nr:calmodulin-dependent protein kinase [Gigaspora margarita]
MGLWFGLKLKLMFGLWLGLALGFVFAFGLVLGILAVLMNCVYCVYFKSMICSILELVVTLFLKKYQEKEAFKYYQKAANMGNTKAMDNVGRCYEKGIGVVKDEKMAFEYYIKSAKKDNMVFEHHKKVENLGAENCK